MIDLPDLEKRSRDDVPFAMPLSARDSEVSFVLSAYAPLANTGAYVQNVQNRKTPIGWDRPDGIYTWCAFY